MIENTNDTTENINDTLENKTLKQWKIPKIYQYTTQNTTGNK